LFANPSAIKLTDSPLAPDALARFIRWTALVSGSVYVLLNWNEVSEEVAADFHACFLALIAGVSLVGAANELIVLFVSLELISIPTYVVLYLPRTGKLAQEAAIKYFLLSVFSSALLLFGFSYLYGVSGTTNLTELFHEGSPSRAIPMPSLFLVAFVMVIAGLGFRITAVPFHFYAPDVIQGAPTGVGATLAFIPKVAGFAALIRVLGLLQGDAAHAFLADARVPLLLWILAIITMTVGNVLAVVQNNLRRILAYSSVAHAGYMLIGLAAAPELKGATRGLEAVLFYLIAYGAMTVGAFAVLSYLTTRQRDVETVDDVAGLGRTHPGIALLMTLFLFSMIGMPLTAGFAGKLLLFFNAIAVERSPDQQPLYVILGVVAAINGAIGAYYYLRIVAAMFLRDALKPLQPRFQVPALAAVLLCAIVTLAFGIYQKPLASAAREAVAPPPVAAPQ
jgi:NADH-quinone oxidoreductase subunit N